MSSEQPQPSAPAPAGDAFGEPAPTSERGGNVALAVIAGIVAALVGAAVYGFILKSVDAQIGYVAIGVGALVGLGLGKLGGNNPVLPFLGVLLALGGVYLGQVFGVALVLAEDPAAPGVSEILTKHFSVINDALKEGLEAIDYVFYVIAAAAGFSVTKKLAD